MSALVRALRGRATRGRVGTRSTWPNLPFQEFVNYFNYNGLNYPFINGSTLRNDQESPRDFRGWVEQIYAGNGVAFACIAARMRLFGEARFQWQRMIGGQPGKLFGSASLELLEHPWGPGSTTRDLLHRMILDVDLSGDSFVTRLPNGRFSNLRPDWTTIVVGSRLSADRNPNWQSDAEVIGYIYEPGGPGSGEDPEFHFPQNVAHWVAHPHPMTRFRGMSWLQPVMREILGDNAAMDHKLKFFENGAVANFVVTLGEDITPDRFQRFVELFEENQSGLENAYATLFFGGGASVQTVGSNLQQLDFRTVQTYGESRIAAASGLPPIVVGLSAGLERSTFANYAEARRAAADMTLRPLWGDAAGSLEVLVDRPVGGPARLWYDDRHISFLAADVKDRAEVLQMEAATINTLITAGYNADDAVEAVIAGDLSLLSGSHTGLVSVQLYPPGKGPTAPNGSGNGKPVLPSPAK